MHIYHIFKSFFSVKFFQKLLPEIKNEARDRSPKKADFFKGGGGGD